MKKKSIFIYLLFLILGMVLGWWIFHSPRASGHNHQQSQATTYTCSMHPQIRQPQPGKCPLCGMDLIPVEQVVTEDDPTVMRLDKSAIRAAAIRTVAVRRSSASAQLTLSGKILIHENLIATITAKFPGRIEKLYASTEGEWIAEGSKLAVIYSPELVTAQRELLEARKLEQISPGLFEAAREKLRLWKISEKQINDIISSNQVNELVDLRADKGGVIVRRLVSAGDYVNTGSPLVEVAGLSKVWAVLDAYESDLPWIQPGMQVKFTTPAFPGRTFSAIVQHVNPVLDSQTRTIQVRAEVNNSSLLLKPGMLVRAELQTQMTGKTEALIIPVSSVLWTGRNSVVYVQRPDDETAFEIRIITLGPRMNDFYIVESGLEEGEKIVSKGAFALDAAAQLSGRFSMMNTPPIKSIEVPESFRQQLTRLVENYFAIKNGLAEDDTLQAKASAQKALRTLHRISSSGLHEISRTKWEELRGPVENSLQHIGNMTHIGQQRRHFNQLSELLIEAVEIFGLTRDKTYRAYCPMAFDNKGADWLSETEEIRNPYFGPAMLLCGENKNVYKKGRIVYGKPSLSGSETVHRH
jgi:Cu(I)/Ag(I) efflux system membrane fusion protein